jgi:hypothetical protein
VAGAIDQFDFDALPVWMRKAHCYDLEREWESFVAYLKSPVRADRDTLRRKSSQGNEPDSVSRWDPARTVSRGRHAARSRC